MPRSYLGQAGIRQRFAGRGHRPLYKLFLGQTACGGGGDDYTGDTYLRGGGQLE